MLRRAHEVRLAGELLAIAQANELQVVALYAAIGVEVPTRELANLLLVHGHKLVYPRLRADGVLIDFCSTDGPAALVKRPRSRLLEPVGAPVDPREINLIVVPSLALDGQLRRLGRGGGSYDRYLPQLSDHTLRVGALAADCVVAWQPVQAHDAQLDAVCTEHGLFGSHAPQ
jgi:5-formyltetrahydrofolate cyclo-ligase